MSKYRKWRSEKALAHPGLRVCASVNPDGGRGDGHRRNRVAAAGTLHTAVIDKLPTRQLLMRCSRYQANNVTLRAKDTPIGAGWFVCFVSLVNKGKN